KIANVNVPKIRIPVTNGRNVTIITEVGQMNFRAKTMGYNATNTFEEGLTRLIEENSGE
ncbi:HPr kinase/phosphorylase, partial [Enterococcus faecalis]|nr:HPr kinase/phosphorylase [Enterococcus faecalis]